MKITRKNYFDQIAQAGFTNLPEELKRAHVVLMTRTVKGEKWQAVDADPELRDLCRIAFAKLEEWVLSHKGKPIPEQIVRKRLHAEARKAALDLIRPYVQKGYTAEAIVAEMPAYRHWLYTIYLDGERLIVQQEHMGKQYTDVFELDDIIRSSRTKQKLEGTSRKSLPNSVSQDVWQAALDIIHYLVVDLDKEVAELKQTQRTIKSKAISAELDGEGYLLIKTCGKQQVNQSFELGALYKKLLKAIQDKEYTTHYHIVEKDKSAPRLNSQEYYFIQSFLSMNGKFLRKETLETFIHKLQKAIQKKEIRKSSPAAEAILEIQEVAVDFFNSMNASETLVLNRDTVKTLEAMLPDYELRTTHSPAPKGKFKEAKNISLKGLAGTKLGDYASIGLEAMLMARFMGFHDQVITRTEIQIFINELQQAIKEKRIRKTSPVAKEVMEIQNAAIQIYNRMDRSLHVVLKPALIKKIKGIIVKFDNAVDRAERPNRDKPKIKPVPLNGITSPDAKVMSSSEFVKQEFERLGFTGKWRDFIGDPSPGFTAMVFGLPKYGKSALCIEWADYLAKNHGNVLYAAKEEGLDATLQEKIKLKQVDNPRLFVSDAIPVDLDKYDFIFLDSVSKLGLSVNDLDRLRKAYPKKSFVFIFQTTKAGKFRGSNEFQHDVDIVIEVPELGKAVQYGRFNQGGAMDIFPAEETTAPEAALDGTPKKIKDRFLHYTLMAGYYEAQEQQLWNQICDLRSSSDTDLHKLADELETKRQVAERKSRENNEMKRKLYKKQVHGPWNDTIPTEEEALRYGKEQTGESIDGIRKSRAQLKNSTRVAHSHRYYYVIDLDERGSFRAHVEDQTGKSVYEFRAGNELGADESDLFQDGWMKGKNDIKGLEKYLRQQEVIGRYDLLSAEHDAPLGTVNRKPRPGAANLTIETELGISLEELAKELLSPKEARTNIVNLIYEDKPRVEEAVKIIAEEFIRNEKAQVGIGEVSFTENDSDNISHGTSYFKVMLEGSIRELKKVAGVDKLFFYDWDNHHSSI